jgi:cell division protein FtsI/penicillin-binding protein 2
MELDAMSSGNNLSQEERNRRRDQKLCFECGFPGYQARDCRKKSQGAKPKRNTWKGKKQLKTMVGQGDYQGTPGHQISMISSL